jgi:two-component system NtrC family sensor kinase
VLTFGGETDIFMGGLGTGINREEIRILCVDDEPSIHNSLKRLFLEDNYSIHTANSGEEGLDILENVPINIVISDGRMYGMTGSAFLSEVCKRWPETVRIVLSAYTDPASLVSAINEGQIYRFIPKPWDNTDLRSTVNGAIERFNLRKKNAELNKELRHKNSELEKLLLEREECAIMSSCMLSAFQHILDAVPTGILAVDPDDMIVQCNERSRQILGRTSPLISERADEALPANIVQCIDEVRKKNRIAMTLNIDGAAYCTLGVKIQTARHKGVVLSFLRADEC